MFSLRMVTFCKTQNCPSSEKLLAFESGEIPLKDNRKIEIHLNECEFCLAEVEFYAHYPQAEDNVVTVDIPIPLYELAEALLSNQHKDFAILNKLLSEKEQLSF